MFNGPFPRFGRSLNASFVFPPLSARRGPIIPFTVRDCTGEDLELQIAAIRLLEVLPESFIAVRSTRSMERSVADAPAAGDVQDAAELHSPI